MSKINANSHQESPDSVLYGVCKMFFKIGTSKMISFSTVD